MTDLHADILNAIKGARQGVTVALVALGIVASAWGIGYLQGARSGEAKATQAEQQAQEHKGRADAQAEAARKADALQAQAQADKAKADAEAARLRAKLARAMAAEPAGNPVHGACLHAPVDTPDVVDSLKDALIEAQEAQIAARDREIVLITTSRDAWKAAHEDRQRETVALRLALDGQKAAVNAALWRGRLQGFAVGIASGYLAGRK